VDRKDHDRGADVRDDEQQLQERSEEDPVVLPGTRDVANGIVEHPASWSRPEEIRRVIQRWMNVPSRST
jgi:hypothetical protein